MALPNFLDEREMTKFKESSAVSGQTGVVVLNPDGTSLGSATSSGTAFSHYSNAGTAATANIKATAGRVFSFSCYSVNAAVRYIQLHNKASAASAAEVPLFAFPVFTNTATVIGKDFFGENGAVFSTGITFAFSTTQWTYTAGTASDQSTQIEYL